MENNVSIGLFLDTRREIKKLGAGVFGVKADLRYMGRRWQFATPFAMTADEWNSIGGRKIRSEALKELKIKMEAYRTKAVNIIESLHPFSYEKFKQLMLGKGSFSKAENRDAYRMFDDYEARAKLQNKVRTATGTLPTGKAPFSTQNTPKPPVLCFIGGGSEGFKRWIYKLAVGQQREMFSEIDGATCVSVCVCKQS